MRNKDISRIFCVITAAVMLIGCLAGCGGGGSASGYVYVPEFTQLEGISGGMNSVSVVGDTVYFTTSVMKFADGTALTEDEIKEYNEYINSQYSTSSSVRTYASGTDVSEEEDVASDADVAVSGNKYDSVEYATVICSMKTDGTGLKTYSDYVCPTSTDDYGYAGINFISADDSGNVWVLEYSSVTNFDLPAGFNEQTDDRWSYYSGDTQTYALKKLSDTGETVSTIDLSSLSSQTTENDYFSVNNMVVDGKGNIIIADSNQNVSVFYPNGELLCTLTWSGWVNSLCVLDGTAYILGNSEDGNTNLCAVDTDAKAFGEAKEISNDVWTIYSGGSDYDYCYSNGTTLYGSKFNAEEPTKILSWLSCDMDSDSVSYCTVLETGDVMALCNDYSDAVSTCYIATLKKTPASQVKQKTTITLATMYTDYDLRAKILNFNKTDPDYRIEVIDYSEFNTDEDYTAGLTKLNTEIVAGNAPDIIAINDFSYDQYAAKGLLEDLYPYMEADSDISADDFIPSILKIQETDGKLYHIGTGFTVNSLVGSPATVGSEPGWTIQEMQEVLDEHPNADYLFGYQTSREDLFSMLLMGNYENYIDWETGECKFDSDEFKSLLTLVNSFPSSEDIDWENSEYISSAELVATGRQLISSFSLWDFTAIQETIATFGNDLVFKGYPCESRQGNIAYIYGSMAITTTCENKDGAWQFIRTLLSEDAQEEMWNGMPINQKVFDAKLKDAMKQDYDENGDPISYGGMSDENGNMIEFYAVTQEQADMILSLIDSVSRTSAVQQDVIDLITEAAAPFFDGSKTVDTVASEIQSRMTIYVNEKR
jgi:ABC-type glycerol-3-phosphate transport system substrate-binding protein